MEDLTNEVSHNLLHKLLVDELILYHQLQSSEAHIGVLRRSPRRRCIFDPSQEQQPIYLESHMGILGIEDNSCKTARRSRLYLGDWGWVPFGLDTVKVCGCFDHLHEGHKELLETAALIANKRLIVSIIESPEKSYMDQYQSFDERRDAVISFLRSVHGKSCCGQLSIKIMSSRVESSYNADVRVFGDEYYKKYDGKEKVIFIRTKNTKHSSDIRKALSEQN